MYLTSSSSLQFKKVVSVRLSIILIESLTFFKAVPIIEYIHDDPFNSRRCNAIIYYFFSILCFADDFNAPSNFS